MVTRILATAFTALALFSSPSHALTLDCKLNPAARAGGWVTEQYVLQVDEGQGTARIADAVILSYFDAPIEAKLVENTDKKLVLSWRVQTKSVTGQLVNMSYRAAYSKSTKAITVRAVPGGYSNDFEARGTCKTV